MTLTSWRRELLTFFLSESLQARDSLLCSLESNEGHEGWDEERPTSIMQHIRVGICDRYPACVHRSCANRLAVWLIEERVTSCSP